MTESLLDYIYGFLLQISASLNMAEENKAPKLMAERTWNYDLF
jgi:hypothetical protein